MDVRLHRTEDELRQILDLQKQNHKDFITPEQYKNEGYVTVLHSYDALKKICGSYGHIIAVDGPRVIGYALTMHSIYADRIPVLGEMMDQIREIEGDVRFLIMGQLCVAKKWRGRGIVKAMYDHMEYIFRSVFPGIYTEVAEDNPRSLRAHLKCNYKVVKSYANAEGKVWKLMYCRWGL